MSPSSRPSSTIVARGNAIDRSLARGVSGPEGAAQSPPLGGQRQLVRARSTPSHADHIRKRHRTATWRRRCDRWRPARSAAPDRTRPLVTRRRSMVVRPLGSWAASTTSGSAPAATPANEATRIADNRTGSGEAARHRAPQSNGASMIRPIRRRLPHGITRSVASRVGSASRDPSPRLGAPGGSGRRARASARNRSRASRPRSTRRIRCASRGAPIPRGQRS